MKDLHSHILFGIDDGCNSIDEAINLLKESKKQGIDEIILTPHYIENSKFNCNNTEKKALFEKLKSKLAEENIQCTLSISLHATNNEKRSKMMPVNNSYPIEELMQACKDYIEKTHRRISFEYALAKDNNDNLDDAKELVKLLKGMICHVNLIPINKIENGKFTKSSNENIMKFRDYLNDHGIIATIRRELGSDIDAACGQLRRKNLDKND